MPAQAPTHSESRSDSNAQGQRSFSQHQSPDGGERQPQRDRRASNRWLEEFQQQTSGNAANSGGTN
jgi:hypothetical protein